jgi:hypothetical protein
MILPLLMAILQVPSTPVAGTYHLIACTAPCGASDTAAVIARGTLVLDSAGPPRHSFSRRTHAGCFVLERRRDHPSYLALFSQGYTSWDQPTPDSIVFDTYRSPDAGHIVRAAVTDSGFVGVGHSWGAGVAAIAVPDETIIGRRIGPPDAHLCPRYGELRRSRWLGPVALVLAAVGVNALLFRGQ